MLFKYEGHNQSGKPLQDVIEADSIEEAQSQLRKQRIYAMKVVPASEPLKTVLNHNRGPFVEESTVPKAPNPAVTEKVVAKNSVEAPSLPWQAEVAKDLESTSDVLRLLAEWSKKVEAAAKEKTYKKPDDIPNVGKYTWDLIKDNLKELGKEAIADVIKRGVEKANKKKQ